MARKLEVFGVALLFALCSGVTYAHNPDPGGPPRIDDNPHPEDNLGIHINDDVCPGGGAVGMGGTMDPQSGEFEFHMRHDDCVREQEVQIEDEEKHNGTSVSTGKATSTSPTTLAIDMTTTFPMSITNSHNNVTVTCVQHTQGTFHTDTNELEASHVLVTCDGSGTMRKKHVEDLFLDVFPNIH